MLKTTFLVALCILGLTESATPLFASDNVCKYALVTKGQITRGSHLDLLPEPYNQIEVGDTITFKLSANPQTLSAHCSGYPLDGGRRIHCEDAFLLEIKIGDLPVIERRDLEVFITDGMDRNGAVKDHILIRNPAILNDPNTPRVVLMEMLAEPNFFSLENPNLPPSSLNPDAFFESQEEWAEGYMAVQWRHPNYPYNIGVTSLSTLEEGQRNSDGIHDIMAGSTSRADMNDDATHNGQDVGLFLQHYFDDRPDADLNLDGSINGMDVGVFLSEYETCVE
ncbi:MAG: hypothetical protein KDD55_07605 [Bdellovibrionales bacterium]|nr:hypothetical protein [Bdellovibrionales bacterium]